MKQTIKKVQDALNLDKTRILSVSTSIKNQKEVRYNLTLEEENELKQTPIESLVVKAFLKRNLKQNFSHFLIIIVFNFVFIKYHLLVKYKKLIDWNDLYNRRKLFKEFKVNLINSFDPEED